MFHLQIVSTSQGHIHKYENLIYIYIYNCDANIYFNQKCLRENIIPNFAKIKIPNTYPDSKFTQQKIAVTRLTDDTKYLYIKKPTVKPTTLTVTLKFRQLMEQLMVLRPKYNRRKTERDNKFTLLQPTGYLMHQQFNVQQLYALPTLYLCVLYLSENKERLVPLTA